MSSAPGWVSYVALALSAGSLFIAVLSYRAGGPRLRLRSQRFPADAESNPFPGGVPVGLTVVNSGRSAVTVEGFHVTYSAGRTPLVHVHETEGSDLPFRLASHASETWVVNARPAAREVDRVSERDDPLVGPPQFRFVAEFGNGKTARDGFSYTAVRLIADAR